jgi:hypothetical protein
LQYHWKREKVTVDRLRVADLVDLAEDGSFAALTVPELDALRRVWPDHRVIRATCHGCTNLRVHRGRPDRIIPVWDCIEHENSGGTLAAPRRNSYQGAAPRSNSTATVDVMLSDYRRWLEYDSVALAVLLVGIGFVELRASTSMTEEFTMVGADRPLASFSTITLLCWIETSG